MKKIALLFSIILLLVVQSCEKRKKERIYTLNSSSLDLEKMADKIMERTNLQSGEKVFMIGRPGEFDSLIVLLRDRISKSGALYYGTINVDTASWPPDWNTKLVKSVIGKSKEEVMSVLDSMDLGIMLPGASPEDSPYAAWQGVMNGGKGRAVHFHWTGAFDLAGSPLEIDNEVDEIYQKTVLETDYAALSAIQSEFEKAIRKNGVTVKTPEGTNLTFKIGDRPVTRQDGDASKARAEGARNLIDREVEIPAGAIRVAPLEETVEGNIAFPVSLWDNQRVEGLVITFKKGKITNIKATVGLDLVKEKLKESKGAYMFREFVLGFNPHMAITDDNLRILYYGYGAGVVRLSLGNNAELGGKVGGDFVRINFFTDATVMTGKDVWVKYGKLVK